LLVSPDQTGFPNLYAALGREPGATVIPVIGYGAAPVASPQSPMLIDAGPDARLGTAVDRPRLTAGRMLRSDDPFEVVADTTAAQAIARRLPETGGNLLIADEADQAVKVNHAIRPQAVALGLFAALTALTALFALGQALSRRLFLASTDNHVLRALGLTQGQL